MDEGSSASGRYGQVLQGVSALVAPATLLTGIAFYFGWARVQAFDAYFGLDPSTVGYSTRDYVLNSLNALFLPVVVVLVTLLALALAHAYVGQVHRTGRRPATLRRLSELGLAGGALLLVVGGFGVFGTFHLPYLISTLFPAAGVLLIAHAVELRARLRGDPPLSTAGRVLVGLFVAVCLFWAAGLYARTVGRDEAARLARHLDELPGVTLVSSSSLALPGGGGGTGVPSHTYGRLRLLAAANGTLFLLPDNWKPGSGVLFSVPQTAAAELAFTPGHAPSGSLLTQGFAGNGTPVAGTRPSHEVVYRHRLGPLVVLLDETDGEPAVLTLANRTGRPVGGVSVSAALRKRAQPLVLGKGALCRVGRSVACMVETIPPRRRVALRIAYRGPLQARGRLVVRRGSVRRTFPLSLSR